MAEQIDDFLQVDIGKGEANTSTITQGGGPTSAAALHAGELQAGGIEAGSLATQLELTKAMQDLQNANQQAFGTLSPFFQAGSAAAGELQTLLGIGGGGQGGALESLRSSPGFQFRMDEGQKALERSAAARGQLFSGATGQALTQFGQNFASNEFNNRFGQLSSLLGAGGNAASQFASIQSNLLGTQTAGLRGQLGSTLGNAALAAGQARASAHLAANQQPLVQKTAEGGVAPFQFSA